MLGNPLLLGDDGYQISRSVRLRSSASAYLNRTLTTPTAGTKFTWSGWVKRGVIGGSDQELFMAYTGSTNRSFFVLTSDTLGFYQYTSGTYPILVNTSTQLLRDPSAWYHIVCQYDSTQATASNRIRIYVNTAQVPFSGSPTYPSLNYVSDFNTATAHAIGRDIYNGASNFDGYLTEINFIDGQALTPSSFGENDAITGVWKPKKYAGTYGTNGFYLNFSDNSAATAAAIGKDYSGNGNNWTPNNISVTAGVTYDSMIDVPTPWADGGNNRGNYCVLNPLINGSSSYLQNGNLTISNINSGAYGFYGSMYSDGWYAEATITSMTGAGVTYCGIFLDNGNGYSYVSDGTKQSPGGNSAYSGATYTTGDVIGIAYSSGSVTFYKNNVSQGVAFSGLSGNATVFLASGSGTARTYNFNFGQRPFTYTPPTGFKALNTFNLPDSTITKGSKYFDINVWSGTGAVQTIVNSGSFQPDFVWGKKRSAIDDNVLYDVIRGAGFILKSNTTDAEINNVGFNLSSFNSNGFSLAAAGNQMNASGQTYVGWQWKGGGTAVSNTAGSITSQVSANASAGFSVVTYTGNQTANASVGHGLGVAPAMVIVKARGQATSWPVYHKSIGATNWLLLNSTQAQTTSAQEWSNQSPTSSVFVIGNSSSNSNQSTTYVAYCWSEVAGFSKFGSYTGNGSADGSFIYTGFRPRFVMVKRTDSTGNWFMYDTSRDTYNVTIQELYANLSNAEAAGTTDLDILSNGFKMRAASAGINASGGTYIFAAFAENPFSKALAR